MKFRILMRTLARCAWRQACEGHIERCQLLFGRLDPPAFGGAAPRRRDVQG
jgi:hypothetical protein